MALGENYFGIDYTSMGHKNIDNECPLTDIHETPLVSQSALIPLYISCDILRRNFIGESYQENIYIWIVLILSLEN